MDTNLSNLAAIGPRFRRVRAGVNDPSQVQQGLAEYEASLEQPVANEALGVYLDYDVPVQFRRWRFKIEGSLAVATLTAALDYGSIELCTLPDLNLAILDAEFVGQLRFGGDFAGGDDGDWGVGTSAAAANPIATTAVNVIPIQALDNIVLAGVDVAASRFSAVGNLTPLAVPDAANNKLFLNFSFDDTQLAADGTITVGPHSTLGGPYLDVYAAVFGNRAS